MSPRHRLHPVTRRPAVLAGCLAGTLLLAGTWAPAHARTRLLDPVPAPADTCQANPLDLIDPRLAAARGTTPPPPTEIAEWKADRRERRRGRQAWIESLHAAPPGIDWRAVESANREAQALDRSARLLRGERTDRWTELGSVDLAGRTHAAHPSSDGTRLYVGSDLGGVWRGTIDGADWTPLSDGLGRGSHQLLVTPPGAGPNEPEVILTLTATTLHASANDGQTWFVPSGLPETFYTVKRIVHDAAAPRTVYLLANGRKEVTGGYEQGYLVLRSTDGGITFSLRHNFGGWPYCDMWIDRVAGGAIYVLQGNTLKISTDGATSFTSLGSAPSGGTIANALLAASEAGAPCFYAALKEGGAWKLYRSLDGGVNWTWRHDITDFWETLVASISDPGLVFYAGVECFRSTNGGGAFTKINDWWAYYGDPAHRLHADLPGMDVHWVDGREAIYFNTDGGTYVSYDGGLTVENLSLWGLAISQYYSTFTSATDPYLIVGGSQDQGYQQSRPQGRTAWLPFEQLISGDYGHLTSAARDHNWLYSVYPGFVLLQKNENPPHSLFQLDFPDCQHSWMPPITADPLDSDVFYFCGDHLWRYDRIGAGYSYARTELPHDFGATGGFLTGMAISPADPRTWYAVTNQGDLWGTRDAGASWTPSVRGPGAHYFYGTALVASPHDPNTAWVGGSGYGGHAVWRTTDGGVTWQGHGTGLPQTLVLGLALGGPAGETPFAACEAGPYAYDETTQRWAYAGGTEAPLTTYWCVEWVPEIAVARFGTYGRGIWDYQPVDPAAVAETRPHDLGLVLEPNPARDRLTVRFRVGRAGPVSVELFDVSGRRVALLASGPQAAGEGRLEAELGELGLASGLYLVRVLTPEGVAVAPARILR